MISIPDISAQYETLSSCQGVTNCFALITIHLFKGKIHPEQLSF